MRSLVAILAAAGLLSQAHAEPLPCAPAADPCVIDEAVDVEDGELDLGDRALVLGARGRLSFPSYLEIRARSLLMAPGARIDSFDPYVSLDIVVDGAFEMQSARTAVATIDIGSFETGGMLTIEAGGDVVLRGALKASASSRAGYGEWVVVRADGRAEIAGQGITATGGNDGNLGGEGTTIDVSAYGDVVIDAPVRASGGSCGSCELAFSSGSGSVTVTRRGSIEASAAGRYGDGGEIVLEAYEGAITVDGPLEARGRGSLRIDSGYGGLVSLFAGGDISFTKPIDVRSLDRYGTAGYVTVSSDDGHVRQAGAIRARGGGEGGLVDLSGPQVTVSDVDVTSFEFGGTVYVDGGEVGFEGRVRTDASQAIYGATDGIVARGRCRLAVMSRARLSAVGVRGGEVSLESPSIAIAGSLRATDAVTLVTGREPPTIARSASIVPSPTVEVFAFPACPP